jgi:hypothetical protein
VTILATLVIVMDFAILRLKFPDTVQKFPNPQNIFPDSLRRELLEKWLQRSGFLALNRVSKPENRKIPCKIP